MTRRAAVYCVMCLTLCGWGVGCGETGGSRGLPEREPVLRRERVSVAAVVPFPRGVVLRDGELVVLSRGRVRDSGGTDVAIDDHAGTLWRVPLRSAGEAPGVPTALAVPTDPPMNLLNRSLPTALDDHRTDRPYCILRYDEPTRSFYFCAFSGIDKPMDEPGYGGYFRKNATDAVFRYDLRTGRYHLLSRGAPLDGPNNCVVVGTWLLVANKESSTVVRYDLTPLRADPEAQVGAPVVVLGREFVVDGERVVLEGHSMLAERDGKLYVGFRTSSAVVRVGLREVTSRRPGGGAVRAELLARFEPYSAETGRSADLTDMAFGPDGRLYVVGAKPARVWRFRPDPRRPLVPGPGEANPAAWAELHALLGKPRMKIESLAVDGDGTVYVTSADEHPLHGASGLRGIVYRIEPSAGTTRRP